MESLVGWSLIAITIMAALTVSFVFMVAISIIEEFVGRDGK